MKSRLRSYGWPAACVLFSLSTALPSHAFSLLDLFEYPASPDGGGGGRYFTGSLRDGMTCEVCHVGGELAEIKVEGFPEGAYLPGETYEIQVSWASAGDAVATSAEIVDDQGRLLGEYLAADKAEDGELPVEFFDPDGGRKIFGASYGEGTSYRMRWKAPKTGGKAILNLAGVVGDGSGDPTGDAVVVVTQTSISDGETSAAAILPSSVNGDATDIDAAQSKDSRFGLGMGFGMIFIVAACGPVLGFVRKRGVALLLAVLAIGSTGCAAVKPYQRGRLAQPDMALDADGDLLAGQRHGTDYREGSSGGFGGGGGGCGCN